jgi:hypothetical protein
MSSPERPTRSREEERAAHNTQLLAQLQCQRQEREHEKMKAEAARKHEEMLRNQRDDDLGDSEPDESGDADMDISPTDKSPTDTNMDAEPTGNASTDPAPSFASVTGLVEGSAEELELLHSLPFNADGQWDDMYRGNNYVPAESMDQSTGEPHWPLDPDLED